MAIAEPVITALPIVSDCYAQVDRDPYFERVIAVSGPKGVWVGLLDDQGLAPLTPSPLQIPVDGRYLECSSTQVVWMSPKGEPELSWMVQASVGFASALMGSCTGDVDQDGIAETVLLLARPGQPEAAIVVVDSLSFTGLFSGPLSQPLTGMGVSCSRGAINFGENNSDMVFLNWTWNGKGFVGATVEDD